MRFKLLPFFVLATVCTTLCTSLCATRASATLIAGDDFESYTAGSPLDGLNGGTGWSGAWSSSDSSGVFSGAVTSGGIPGTGLSAQLGAVGGTVADEEGVFQRAFTPQSDPNTDLYVGLVLRTNGPLDESDFLQFYFNQDLGSANTTGLSAGLRNNAGNPYFVRKGGAGQSTNASLLHQNDTVTQLVIRLGKSGNLLTDPWDEISLFVNQGTEGTPDAERVAGNAGINTTPTIGAFHVRMFSFEDTQNAFIDSIRITDNYAEALPAIPEPSTFALLTAGLLVLLRRIRRA